jgi:hypothetical protein
VGWPRYSAGGAHRGGGWQDDPDLKVTMAQASNGLDSRRKRLAVFGVLIGLAAAAIWVIDSRAIQRQQQMRRQFHRAPPTQPAGEAAGAMPRKTVPAAAARSSEQARFQRRNG